MDGFSLIRLQYVTTSTCLVGSSGHAQKCFSVKSFCLPDITPAAVNGTLQQPTTFDASIKKFCNTLKLRFLHFLNNILEFDL
jgi:hypothetical protein